MVRIALPGRLRMGRYALIGCGVVLLAGIGGTYALTRPKTDIKEPSYDIVLPQHTPIDDLGGWRRVSPIDKPPVFAYDDTINDVPIIVSQQPMPETFRGNVAASVRQLAESGSYSTVIEAGGTQVYIGRSARGPQSAVFAKNDVLVFIKTQKTISQTEWIRYINNLVDPKTEQTPTF